MRAVVEAFVACLPAGERRRLYAGMPGDLRRLAVPRHRCRWTNQPADLVSCVAEVSGLGDLIRAERVTVAVLGALSDVLRPADAARIGVALPPALRPLWQLARHQGHPTGARPRRVWRQVCPGEWQWTLTPNEFNPNHAHGRREGR